MAYATVDDVKLRYRGDFDTDIQAICATLLEDAAVIIDSYSCNCGDTAKAVVSCNMVVRAIDASGGLSMPIGASQGTMSALGYSQTFTMNGGSVGELYLSKLDKRILKVGNAISARSPLESLGEEGL